MWEAIDSNRRRSNVLIGVMGLVLVLLGSVLGMAIVPEYGTWLGVVVAIGVWGALCAVALTRGEQLLLLSASAHEIQHDDSPRLMNVVEEMTIASGLKKPPKVYVIDSEIPNAFAAGSKPETAAVAVTSGLLRMLTRDELQGVLAHEIGHIKNQDVRFMTIASVMLGSIVLISESFLRYMFYAGARRRVSPRGGPRAQIAVVVAAVVAAILAPILARLLYLACSRKREYLADASAARFTRFPDGLAAALEKIEVKARGATKVGRVVAPLYIVNPLQASARGSRWLSTHPPTDERVRILRSMGGRAGFVDYESAFRKVRGSSERCLGLRSLSSGEAIPARPPSVEKETKDDVIERAREVAEIVDRMADYLMIACVCGVRIKLPPAWKRPTISCPRCGVEHDVPHAEPDGTDANGEGKDETGERKEESAATERAGAETADSKPKSPETDGPMHYTRQGTGWEAFKCACGSAVQISPSFRARSLRCPKCRKHYEIREKEKEPEAASS